MKRENSSDVLSAAASASLQRLSPRQRDIAERYASGLTYKQIAAELFIAPATVRNHLATI
jgi:DNA-binding CsgD family transcriptional regulator